MRSGVSGKQDEYRIFGCGFVRHLFHSIIFFHFLVAGAVYQG